jgi:hypothetical protein
MRTRTKVLIGSVIAAGLVASAVGVGIAAGADDGSDAPLGGDALDRATAAALAHTGGGEVIETETGDGGAAYGVEIREEDGTVVEISLDADFRVIGSESDDDGAAEGTDAD